MNRVTVCLIVLFLVIGFCILPSRVNGDNFQIITINSDGSVSPPDAPLFTVDNITYSLTNDMTGLITVERDNITLNGAGHDMTGDGNRAGVQLQQVNNVTIGNMTIGTVGAGIWLYSSSHSVISGNNITGAVNSGILISEYSNNNTVSSNSITNSTVGMYLESSPNNTVSGNNIETYANTGIALHWSPNNIVSGNNVTNNYFGISCAYSNNITIIGNTVADNGFLGIWLVSSNCTICHNNFMNNTNQLDSSGLPNVWNNDFEGNYWSDYNGSDNNQDGIGDTPYIIDENNTDHYPLMGEFHDYITRIENSNFIVEITSNSTISAYEVLISQQPSDWYPSSIIIYFNVTGQAGQGFCRICITSHLPPSYILIDIGQTPVTFYNGTLFFNSTHRWIYFTYPLSTHKVMIVVPEFPTYLILPLFFIATLLAVVFYRKKHAKIS